jgi:hypothetical protein
MDKIQAMIQTITKLINDLKNSKDIILQQSSQLFVEICLHLAIENPILEWIPSGIRCENYVPLNIHLVRIRSILQEQKFNIEEKTIILWQEQTNEQGETDENFFQPSYRNDESETSEPEETNNESAPSSPPAIEENSVDKNQPSYSIPSSPLQETPEVHHLEEPLVYSSLFQFDMKLVPCSSSNFLQQLHQYRIERIAEAILEPKVPKFAITHPNGVATKLMFKADKFQERLRKIFDDHHYDHDQYVLVDKNEIFVDFNKNEFHPSQISSLEYRIVEREHLVCVEFQFRSSTMEYHTTSTNRIATVIKYFIDVNQPQDITTDTYLCFFDRYEACIEDVSMEDLREKKAKLVSIIVKEKTLVNNMLCEINLAGEESNDR